MIRPLALALVLVLPIQAQPESAEQRANRAAAARFQGRLEGAGGPEAVIAALQEVRGLSFRTVDLPAVDRPSDEDWIETYYGSLRVLDAEADRFDTAAHGGDGDGIVSRNDLVEVAGEGNWSRRFTPQMVSAARFLLENPRLLRHLDLAAQKDDGWPDERISVGPGSDVQEALLEELAVRALASGHNDVFVPETATGRPASDDGVLRIASWNLHVGKSRRGEDQIDLMTEHLTLERHDLYLLQEVRPRQARRLVEALGYRGYYSRTTRAMGNLVLVHPELEVVEERVVVVNASRPCVVGDLEAAFWSVLEYYDASAASSRSDRARRLQPRTAQLLRIESPGGRTAVVWNTHLSAHRDESVRVPQIEAIVAALGSMAGDREPVLGGGDLNSEADGPVADVLAAGGLSGRPHGIDWLVARNAGRPVNYERRLYWDEDIELSDHDLIRGAFRLP